MSEISLSTVEPENRERPIILKTEATRAIEADAEIQGMSNDELIAGIQRLRKERDAVILAHNYEIGPIQDIADFVGDSLQLSQQAAETDAKRIVFCGVHFMAETAAILSPTKQVLIPDSEAGCSLAAMVSADEVRRWRAKHPGAVIVAYVNTTAEVKAEVDYCCTSSNAVKVVASIPKDKEVLFLPDFFLGLYIQRMTGRKLHLWMGECHVHAGIRPADIHTMWEKYPEADLVLHPECGCVSQCMLAIADGDLPADKTHVLSTGGMVQYAKTCTAKTTIVGTEVGMLHRMRKENPNTQFVPLKSDAICEYMKTINIPKLYRSLRDLTYEVTVPEPTATRARGAIERMMEHL
jgi:quinolinate synthase